TLQSQRKQILRRAAQVNVRIIKTRHYKRAMELHRLRVRLAAATLQQNLVQAAHAQDFPVANGHARGPWVRAIVGVNSSMEIVNGVMRSGIFLRKNARGRANAEKENNQTQCAQK